MNAKSMRSICRTGVALLAAVFEVAVALASDAPRTPLAELSEPASDGITAMPRTNDFFVTRSSLSGDVSKFITYGWIGWTPNIVHWAYNDTNRNPVLASTSSAAVASIQSAMNKWTAACNIQFVYDGSTNTGPSLAGPSFLGGGNSDGLNVIAWGTGGSLSGNTTSATFVSASGSTLSSLTLNESDLVINYANNASFDVTLLHEIGHMIGLEHSNVEGQVMSGPNPDGSPLTSYTSLSSLQSDDIAGCQSLYGAPVSTARTISGAITNGAGVSSVTFCARPAAGVTCTASNASGVYSCTVPNGWAGTLHSPSVANNRIPPQTFTAVNANVTRNVSALSGVPVCNLDVDNNGLIAAATDGAAIIRRMMGYSAAAFGGLAGICAANTTSSAIFNATASDYNVTGGAATRFATDGLVIWRAMIGKTDADVTNGLGLTNEAGATNTSWLAIQSWLNATCGSSF